MQHKTIFSTRPSSRRPPKRAVPRGGIVKLYKYQERAVARLRGERLAVLTAPVGSGKSVMVEYLGLDKLSRHAGIKLIVLIPERSISSNFTAEQKFRVRGQTTDWAVGHDLSNGKNTVQKLIDFLTSRATPRTDMPGRTLVATHAAAVAAFEQLASQGRLDAFRNTCVWFDEGHHILNAMIQGSDDVLTNGLGKLVRHLVSIKAFVGLTTATPFRGDSLHWLDDELRKQFAFHNVTTDEVDREKPYPPFHYDIVCGTQYEAVKRIFRSEPNVPTIIWLAKRNSHHAEQCKYGEVRKLRRVLPKGLAVLDLVDETDIRSKLELLARIRRGEAHVDVIIALERCKEGFDWPAMSRGIILGERHSITEVCQTIGRFLRPNDGKKASIYQVLPTPASKRRLKDHKNRCLTMIFAGMTMAEYFAPERLTMGGERVRGKVRRLTDLLDVDEIAELMEAFTIAVEEMDWEESQPMRDLVLKSQGIAKKDRAWVWRACWTRLALTARYARGLAWAPFNILKKERLWDGLLNLSTDLIGLAQMKQLREAIAGKCMTDAQAVALAEKLSKAQEEGKLHLFEKRVSA